MLKRAKRSRGSSELPTAPTSDVSALLIHNALSILPGQQRLYALVDGDRISEVGETPSPELLARADEAIDADGMALIPGLVNAHTHLFQTFLRGLGDDKPLLDWLRDYIWPAARAMSEDDLYWSALLGIVENLRGGATAAIDNSYVQTNPGNMDAVVQAARDAGFRLVIARGYVDTGYPEVFLEAKDQILAEMRRLLRTYPPTEFLGWTMAPVVPWGVSDELMLAGAHFAQEHGLAVHIHTAESRGEIELIRRRTGLGHVEWFHRLGVLADNWQLVHAVHLSDVELELVRQANATLIYNPVSNMYLASGIPPIAKAHRLGIRVAWATDGPGSNNSQDMLEVLKTGVNLQKIGESNAQILSNAEVLEMATRGGHAALGLVPGAGRLVPGAPADLTLVNLRNPHCWPAHNPLSAIVYNATRADVDTVLVAGRALLRRGRITFLDESALLDRTARLAHDLRRRADCFT
jgi:5-methylthioadenosine/S-adenosylhomocysteine deaminase